MRKRWGQGAPATVMRWLERLWRWASTEVEQCGRRGIERAHHDRCYGGAATVGKAQRRWSMGASGWLQGMAAGLGKLGGRAA